MSSDPLLGLRFFLRHPDGRQESLLVDADRALIGSAAHCEVRLDPELAAHEHIEVYAHEGAIWFSTHPSALAVQIPTLGGVTTAEARWDTGAVLALGAVQMSVELVGLAPAKARPPYRMLLALVPAFLVTITAVAFARAPRRSEPPIPEAPALFPPKSAATCPNVAADQRSSLAAEKLRVAVAKRERSPFSPVDGFDAVLYFETAAACYRGAAMSAEAMQSDQAADTLRSKLEEDYRVRRVRIEHAYRVHDLPALKRELAVLLPMTSRHHGLYVDWLKALDRAASAELDDRHRISR